MRRFFLVLLITVTSFSTYAQISSQGAGRGGGANYDVFLTNREAEENEEFKKIAHKMYLTTAYLPAKVDNINETFYLRYNMYRDQMEFTKGEEIVYLKKEVGRKVTFTGLNTQYIVLDMNGKLNYFVLHNDGKNSLLSKLRVKYQEEQPARSTYQQGKSADFKRRKNELYIAFNNVDPIKIPTKKSAFYNVFGSKSSQIKNYMKKNKLSSKKLEDIKKIVKHFNTL